MTGLFYYLVRRKRFELLTPWFVAKYSIQLSYRRLVDACRDKLSGNAVRIIRVLAETEGFEPSIQVLPVCSLSRGVPSTTRPCLRTRRILSESPRESYSHSRRSARQYCGLHRRARRRHDQSQMAFASIAAPVVRCRSLAARARHPHNAAP